MFIRLVPTYENSSPLKMERKRWHHNLTYRIKISKPYTPNIFLILIRNISVFHLRKQILYTRNEPIRTIGWCIVHLVQLENRMKDQISQCSPMMSCHLVSGVFASYPYMACLSFGLLCLCYKPIFFNGGFVTWPLVTLLQISHLASSVWALLSCHNMEGSVSVLYSRVPSWIDSDRISSRISEVKTSTLRWTECCHRITRDPLTVTPGRGRNY
jgi:hypothetical protein